MSELHRLHRCYGFAGEFKSGAEAADAAQFRVACRENQEHGGIHVRSRSWVLAEARQKGIVKCAMHRIFAGSVPVQAHTSEA